jgi:hypothetical protein
MRAASWIALLALTAVSAGCLGSSSAPAKATPAALVKALDGDGFTSARALPGHTTVVPCDAMRLPGGQGRYRHARFGAAADLDVTPETLPQDSARTSAMLVVIPRPGTAAACARQMLASDRRTQHMAPLTSDMIEAKNTGGAGQEPLKQGGVVTDGTYEIFGSHGHILFLGLARNRHDADAVERGLRAAAGSFH